MNNILNSLNTNALFFLGGALILLAVICIVTQFFTTRMDGKLSFKLKDAFTSSCVVLSSFVLGVTFSAVAIIIKFL